MITSRKCRLRDPGVSTDGDFRTIELLHHIAIVDGFGLPKELPPLVEENARAMQRLYPAARYRMWDGRSIQQLISDRFDASVLEAFKTLRPYTYKANLARYCVLYLFGGLYADLDVKFLNPMRIPSRYGLASFRDVDLHSPSWIAVNPKILWAAPERREFRIAIDYVVENCRERFYGETPNYPTGPVLFGQALVAAMVEGRRLSASDQWIGSTRGVTPEHPQKNYVYVSPDRSLTALNVKRIGSDITQLGLEGTNDYNHFWHRRTAYGERASFWSFADPAIKMTHRGARTSTGIEAISDEPGHLTFGPYIGLEPGRYRLVLAFEGAILLPAMTIEVTHDCGERLGLAAIGPGPRSSPFEAIVEFASERGLRDVEFRTDLRGPMTGHITSFRLETLG